MFLGKIKKMKSTFLLEGEEGFGLVEAAIVLAIISILLALVYLLLTASDDEQSHKLRKQRFNRSKMNANQTIFMESMNLQQLILVNIKSHQVELIVALLERLV